MPKSFAATLSMKRLPAMLFGLGLTALPLWAVPQSDNAVQTTATGTPSAAEAPGIPHLVASGVIRDTAGKPITVTVAGKPFSFELEGAVMKGQPYKQLVFRPLGCRAMHWLHLEVCVVSQVPLDFRSTDLRMRPTSA